MTSFQTKQQILREVTSGRGWKTSEAEKGKTQVSYTAFGDILRLEHPANMGKYEEWGKDAEARVALEVLKNLIAGVGYYTEMDEKHQPKSGDKPHPNKVLADEYGEAVNLDEKLQYVEHTTLHKGFCPVEVIEDYDIKLLPPESFYIYMDKKGKLLKYTQERSIGDVITEWKTPEEIKSIVPFFFGWSTSSPYGMSLLEPIGSLLDARTQMNTDMPKAVHRWAYPVPIMETSGSKDSLQKACEERDVDEWIFVGNVNKDEVRWNTLAIDPNARFIPYIELVYYQICEGLHAPLLLYLKNATEASATVMMESVDRLVTGRQRYIKRRVEEALFKPQTGDPVPRIMWGQPKTGLEDVTLQDLSAIMPYLAKNQQQHLLKQYVGSLPEPEWEQPNMPQLPFGQQPFQKKQPGQEIPVEAMIERLNDLQTSLDIIETNYKAHKIKLTEACKLADRTITVHVKRAYVESEWEAKRDEKFQWFLQERLAPALKKVYQVSVPD